MTRRITHKTRAVALATAMGVGLSALILATPASAENSYDFVQAPNASDPSAFPCRNPADTTKLGYCLVTSQDLSKPPNGKPLGQGLNYYPMDKTLSFFSKDGLKWDPVKTAVTESQLTRSTGGNLGGTEHLWAPAVRFLETPGGRAERPSQNYYLYTPDLLNPNNEYSSRIWVTYSVDPLTGYGATNIWGLSPAAKSKEIAGIPSAADEAKFSAKYPLYMSDPDVFTDTGAVNHYDWAHEYKDYLLWANGDAATCGDLSLRKMINPWTVQSFKDPKETWLPITGLNSGTDALGTCTKKWPTTDAGRVIDRPYIEGGTIFHSDRWAATETYEGMPGPYVLVFSAKPSKVPTRCSSNYGETNSSNEVIGYATAGDVDGPYTYQGIIMCGNTKEYTNQATIQMVKGADNTDRLVIVYHDGADPAKNANKRNRTLHSECLYVVDGKFNKVMRSEGSAQLNGTKNWCLAKPDIRAIKSVKTQKYLATKSNALYATSGIIGNSEVYSMKAESVGYSLNSHIGHSYVTANSDGKVTVMTGSVGTREKLVFVSKGSGQFQIKGSDGKFLQVQANNRIGQGSTSPSATDTSYLFTIDYLTN